MRASIFAASLILIASPAAAAKIDLTCNMFNMAGELVTLDFVLDEATKIGDYTIRENGFHKQGVPAEFTSKVVTLRASSDPSFVNTYTIDRVTLALEHSAMKDGVQLFVKRGKCELAKNKF